MSWRILHGDCLDVLPTLEAESVEACVTDPPYALTERMADRNIDYQRTDCERRRRRGGFMGKAWDAEVPGVEVWREVLRVLKPGGHLLAFGGTRTYHRLACAIEDAGFEVRDCLMWIYGSGFPKSLNLGNGFGTALKPAYEPILLARKPLAGTVAQTVARYGTGALNIDGCRIGTTVESWPASRSYAPGQIQPGGVGKTQATGSVPPGRWPANVLHDGSDEVVAAFPQSKSTGGAPVREAVHKGSVYDNARRDGATKAGHGDSGSAARFFYCAKASRAERERGLDEFDETRRTDGREKDIENPRLRTSARKNHHPTVKPISLMRYLVRLVTPPGGTVLDPFAGSGSTLVAAIEEGFDCLGIEREAEYVPIIEARCRAARRDEPKRSPTLFDEVAS